MCRRLWTVSTASAGLLSGVGRVSRLLGGLDSVSAVLVDGIRAHRWQICRCVASRATTAVPTVLVGLESRGRGSSVLGGFYCVSAGSSILSVSGVGRGRSVSGAGVCVGVCVCVASRADTDAELTLSKRTTRNERKVSIYTVSHKNRQKNSWQ